MDGYREPASYRKHADDAGTDAWHKISGRLNIKDARVTGPIEIGHDVSLVQIQLL